MLSLLLLFIFYLNLAWTWAQTMHTEKISFRDILATAAIEWGASLNIIVSHFWPLRRYLETPPLDSESLSSPLQLPILFVPSLNTHSSVFFFLFWRLKKNYWKSLWPFRWKSFLKDPILLADQLTHQIEVMIKKTGAKRFRVISFGGSRPLVSYVLSQQNLSAYCDKWIAISAPEKRSRTNQLLSTERQRAVYEDLNLSETRKPDLLIVGENDLFCYPDEVWGDCRKIEIPNVGHYGAGLHSTTTQNIMKEMNQ